jgi:hypothetical protein
MRAGAAQLSNPAPAASTQSWANLGRKPSAVAAEAGPRSVGRAGGWLSREHSLASPLFIVVSSTNTAGHFQGRLQQSKEVLVKNSRQPLPCWGREAKLTLEEGPPGSRFVGVRTVSPFGVITPCRPPTAPLLGFSLPASPFSLPLPPPTAPGVDRRQKESPTPPSGAVQIDQ